MDNTTAFTTRLQKLLDYYDLSASGFATKVGVQRSSISHILSGRNKPSLDFVMKILHTFQEVSIDWLMDGKGSFPKSTSSAPPIISSKKSDSEVGDIEKPKKDLNTLIDQKNVAYNTNKEIAKIIILYSDGSFEAYKN